MKIILVNPPLLSNKGDIYGGIPSLPTGITYVAGYLRNKGYEVSIIDCFGEAPLRRKNYKDKYWAWGIDLAQALERITRDISLVGISVHSVAQDLLAQELIKLIKEKNSRLPVVVGGAYPTCAHKRFLEMGADYVVLSEGEETADKLLKYLKGEFGLSDIDGLAWREGFNPKTKFIEDLDSLPYPAVDLLPLENYWKLGYAHGPVSGKYTFLITSRGCPYNCNFCAAPYVWQRKHRFHSSRRVVDEIEFYNRKYGIDNFHIQDDGFATNRQRIDEISNEIRQRNLRISWGLPAGVKAETIGIDSLKTMKKAGFNYLSVSPESGSERVLNLMNKPLNREHLLDLLKAAQELKITTQSCFVLGYPGEQDTDRELTGQFIKEITRLGVDEIAIYIMSPLPGSYSFAQFFPDGDVTVAPEEISFSPRWRKDYVALNRVRSKMYFAFFLNKMLFHPVKCIKSLANILTRRFQTKMEMTIYRLFKANLGLPM